MSALPQTGLGEQYNRIRTLSIYSLRSSTVYSFILCAALQLCAIHPVLTGARVCHLTRVLVVQNGEGPHVNKVGKCCAHSEFD